MNDFKIDTERVDCSPDTNYNALVFDAHEGRNLIWRFMVFHNLKVVDKVQPLPIALLYYT